MTDGVGGWEESGVDPSHFSQALMWFARERVRNGSAFPLTKTTEGEEGVELSGKGLRELLEGAFQDVQEEKGIVAGEFRRDLFSICLSYLILRCCFDTQVHRPRV